MSGKVSLSPAANIAVTVATAMAERGDDVGPNVTLVLLAELESSQVLLASRDQRIKKLSRYAMHEFGCPAIGAAGACDCGVEELWDHG